MRNTSKLVWIGIGLLLVLLAANGYVSHLSLQRVAKDNSEVRRVNQLLFETEHLKTLLVDAETGQRGYLITGDATYLDPYTAAIASIDSQVDRVASLTVDSERRAKLVAVRHLAHQKLDELSHTVDLARNGQTTAARALVLTNRGQKTMEQMRDLLADIERSELTLESQRVEETQRSTRQASLTFAIATAVGAISLIIFAGMLSRERKKSMAAAMEVIEQREWLNTTLRSIGDAVIATDSGGQVVFLNSVAESLTGYASIDAHGLSLRQVFPIFNESTQQPVEDPVEKVLRLGTVVGLANHTVLKRRDGTQIAIDDSAAPIRNADGELIGVVLVFRDVTRQREIDAALRNAEKLATAGRFAATVAHEINNPLEAAMNSLYLLGMEQALSADGRKYLQMADQELSRVAAVARQTLAFYKDTSSPVSIPIPVLLEEILSVYDRRFESRGIRIVRCYDEHAICVGSSGELRQVFSNLILNALDAVRANGTIALRVTRENISKATWVRVEVEDNGEGIAPENLERIFEPFFTTNKDVGSGLGLWSAKTLVEKHGGMLEASSSNGTTRLTVTLPVEMEATAMQQAS